MNKEIIDVTIEEFDLQRSPKVLKEFLALPRPESATAARALAVDGFCAGLVGAVVLATLSFFGSTSRKGSIALLTASLGSTP